MAMRYLYWLAIIVAFCSCDEKPTNKPHDILAREMPENYQKQKRIFQSLAIAVSAFKQIRSIDFLGKRNSFGPVTTYCANLDRDSGFSIGSNNLYSPFSEKQFQAILATEQLSASSLRYIKSQLDSVNCHSFLSFRTINPKTGTSYIHIELEYNESDGVRRYFYKLFDKKLEPDLVQFFDRSRARLGSYTDLGSVLDSNAVWYFSTD